jgi:ATP-dependent helicase/nuclease subunit A
MPTESLRSDVQPVPAKSTPPLPSDFGLRTSDFGLPAAERLVGRVLWEYPHARLAGTASQASVTGLAKAGRPDRPAAPPKPAFLAEKPSAVGPADIGTAVHVLMRHVDLATPAGRIDEPVLRGLLDSLIERGLIPEGLRGKLPLARVLAFFRSEPGRTMLARPADVLREVPVTFTVPASALDPGLPMPDAAEPVMVRGAVDALIRLPGGAGFWLLDYKTDAAEPGSDPAAAAARHRTQLELYRRAVAEAWGRPVPRATLCLLTLGECIDL